MIDPTGRRIAGAIAAALLVAGVAAAQPHGTDLLSVDAGGRIWKTALDGTATSLLDTALPAHGLCLHHDNRALLFTQSTLSTLAPSGLYRYDPTTATRSTVFEGDDYAPFDVVQNADGDYVFTGMYRSGSTWTPGVFKYTGGVFSTIVTTVQLGVSLDRLNAGVTINLDTGNYLVVAGAYPNIGAQWVWDVSDQGAITTLGSTGNSRYSHVQDRRTGDVWISGYQTVYRLARGAAVHTTPITGPSNFYAIAADRVSDPTSLFYARTANKLLQIDVTNDVVVSLTTSQSGSTAYEAIFDRSRNIATVKTGAATWDIRLDFPGEGGRLYHLAMGLSGTRAPTTVSDGRRIHLVFDELALLTVAGELTGILDGSAGTLDPTGRATARLRLGWLPRVTTPFFLCAATFRPGGFGTITDPFVAKFVK